MKPSFPKRLGKTALRAALVFLAFNLVSLLSRAIFKASLLEEDMLSPRALGAWNAVFLFFIFQSTVFAFHRHREDARQVFWEGYAEKGLMGNIRSVFLSMDLYVEYMVIVLLSLLVPLPFDCVGMAFFGEGFTAGQVVAVSLPILLVLEIIAHLSVRSAWGTDAPKAQTAKAEKTRSPLTKTVKSVGFAAFVYGSAAVSIPWFLPVIITLGNLGGGAMVFLYIAIAVVMAILSVVGIYYLRAMKKRKEFVTRLKKYCGAQSVTLSDIRRPYRSLFAQHRGFDFTMETGGQAYACKLMGSVFPGSPMVFADTGEGIRQDTLRMFRVDILQVNTRVDYRMEDAPPDSKKILIVVPVPQNIYASVGGSPPRPADTGEPLGEYTLYNATGFFGALERGHLGVRR